MEKKEKPIYYGILMNRKLITQGIYLFHPEYLIEGEVIENEEGVYFLDKLGTEYLTIHDTEALMDDEEQAVGYIISQDELKNRYGDLDIDEVKISYFNYICSNIHIGFYIIDEDIIGVIPFDFASIATKINSAKVDPNSAVLQIPIDDVSQTQMSNQDALDQLVSNYGGQEVIAISMEEFKKILQIEDPKKIKETLEEMYKDVNEVNSYFLDKEKEATLKENSPKEDEVIEDEKIINVSEMKKFFDERIIGQEEAKRDVISAIVMNKLSDNPNDRNSCLLVGPTGSGKTLLAETTSKYFDMPMEIIDTTQLSVPGYEGANIEDFLARLLNKAGGLQKAQEGIVVFDEIDKKGSGKNSDVSGKGVLNTLLSFLQGTTYDIKYNNRVVHFDTSKLTVFATGAFTDVAQSENSNDNGYNDTKLGFNANLDSNGEQDIKYKKLEINDFVKYGHMPVELMGRFTTIAQLTGHTKESLKTILTESNISALLAEKQKLEKIQVELTWTDGYLDAVADKAFELKTGARSLKNTVELSVKEARWEVLNNLDTYKAIILTEKTVQDNFDCTLVDILGESHNLKDIIASKEKQKTLKK